MDHRASTYAWVAVLLLAVGGQIGFWFGVRAAPSYHDARVIEQHLRAVFCEQAVRNKLMTTCEVDK